MEVLFLKTLGTYSPLDWQVGKRTLKRKLLHCLSEGARQLTIQKLKSAKVISIQQDLFFLFHGHPDLASRQLTHKHDASTHALLPGRMQDGTAWRFASHAATMYRCINHMAF